MSEPVPKPVHCFLFHELNGPQIHDQISGLGIQIDRYVPVHGCLGGALRFGSAGAQVGRLPELADLPLPWSLSVWIRREADATSSTLLSSDTGGIKIEQWGAAGRLGITQYGVRDWASAAVLPLAKWCHLVLVAELEETRFYLDGVLAGTTALGIPLPRKWLGSSGGWTEFLQASIEDLRIYSLPLTPDQVLALARPQARPAAELALTLGNGDALATEATLPLGLIPAGQRGSLDLRVINQGTVPLIFTPTLQDGSGQFSLKLPTSRSLEPGAAAQLTVVFRPQLQGPVQGQLTLESNDPLERAIVLPLSAIGDVPAQLPAIRLRLAQTPIAQGDLRWLGRVLMGCRKAFPVNICNTGTAPLRFELAVDGPAGRFAFWQGAGPFELEAGGEFCADLAFAPDTATTAQAMVTIRSNDPDSPSYQFSVYARGETAQPALHIGPASPSAAAMSANDQPVVLASAPVGQTIQQHLCLRNAGSGTVILRAPLILLETSDDAFAVEQPASLTIPFGGLLTVPITFAPTTSGQKTGKLRIDWNGGVSELQFVAHALL